MELHHQRHNEQGHNVDDFDQRIDGGASRVLVGVTHGVTGYSCFVRFRAFAAVMTIFNIFFRIVPCATARGHREGDEQAADNHAEQQREHGRDRVVGGVRCAGGVSGRAGGGSRSGTL